jgi:HPt (histidine-containing phosphotransfer) domain-containing protein
MEDAMGHSTAGPGRGSGSSVDAILDLDHLSRMTLDDRALEREVLELFERQVLTLAERLDDSAAAPVVASCAHTLKGSARGIGAWRLASAAQEVERAATAGDLDLAASIVHFHTVIAETRTAIAARLRE